MPDHIPPPSSLPPGSSVWAYLRDSGGPSQDRSVGQQKAEIEEYCKHNGLALSLVFADVARSGGSTTTREQFNEMVDMSQHQLTRPDGILIWNYARFARDLDDSQFYKATLRKRGITIHSLTDPVPEGVYGQVVEVIIDIANQEKKRQTSRDAQRGLHELVEKYGCIPGTPPRGFMREPVELGLRRDKTKRVAHRWVPDPEWIPRIQKAFEMRASGASLQEINRVTRIYRSLNSYTTFWNNALYRGTLVYGDLTIDNYCEPIVDNETWDIVQNISKGNAKHGHMKGLLNHPRRVHSNYLLSGLAKCGRCGAPLYGQVSPQRYGDAIESYRCNRGRRRRDCDLPRIPGYAFEQGILDKLQSVLTDPRFYINIYRNAQAKQGKGIREYQKKRQEKQKEINILRRKIDNLTAAIAESGHSRAMLDSLAEIETEVADVQKQIEEIKKKQEQPLEDYSDEELASYSRYLAQELQSRDIEDRRRVLRGLVYEIIVDRIEDVLKCEVILYIVSPHKVSRPSFNLLTSGPSAQRDSRGFRENNNYAWSVVNSHVSVGAQEPPFRRFFFLRPEPPLRGCFESPCPYQDASRGAQL